MSLAQRLDPATIARPSLLLSAEQGRAADPSAEKHNISLLRRVQAEQRIKAGLSVAEPARPSSAAAAEGTRRFEGHSHSIAINLIDEVSSIIPVLVDENETLRAALKRDREKLEADVERATLVACEWRKSAENAKAQIETLERKLAETAERLDRSEARLVSEKELASRSARDAAEAECLSSLFEEKLLSSFGTGSLFQQTLDRIRQRAEIDVL